MKNNFTPEFKSDWINKNKKLAYSWAAKYAHSYQMVDHLPDMIHEGILGLLKGLNNYDPTRGNAKISTICSNEARAAIQKYINTHRYSLRVSSSNKIDYSFEEIEENSLAVDDIANVIESEDSRDDHDLYEYLKILTPLQKDCFLYKNKLKEALDPKLIPLAHIVANTAEIKLKHFFVLNN